MTLVIIACGACTTDGLHEVDTAGYCVCEWQECLLPFVAYRYVCSQLLELCYTMLLAASAVGRRAPTRLLATTAQPTRLLATTTARRAPARLLATPAQPTRLLATTPARRRNDRPAVNQRLLRLVDDGPKPGAAVGDLWAGVEGAQGAWPARDRLESKSDMKRHLRYLASLKLLRTVPGEPFRYALNRNAYVRRELEEEEDDAPAAAEDSKQ